MYITQTGNVVLDTGEAFIYEEQDAQNIMRIATYTLANGNSVLIYRHFSQIGPIITDCNGERVQTHVVDGKVVPL
jgi:hypothetical protein